MVSHNLTAVFFNFILIYFQEDESSESRSGEPGPHQKSTKQYQPIIQSNLKFAAYGFKFVKNTLHNYPKYLQRMKILQENLQHDNTDKGKVEKFQSFLRQIDVEHIVVLHSLYDVYNVVAKAQHGVSKVNQLPWEYGDRVERLEAELTAIKDRKYNGSSTRMSTTFNLVFYLMVFLLFQKSAK